MLCWSSCEEIPHSQGKRNPSKMVGVARGHQRADTLKPYSQKTNQSNHPRTTALSNSMKPSHACGATKDGRVMVERSDRAWSTGEIIALTRQTLVGKVMSLLLNMLSRLLITFLPRNKCLLISWLQSPSVVILNPPQKKASHCFPIYFP